MNNVHRLLLSSLLLGSAACAADDKDIAAAQEAAMSSRAELVSKVFESLETVPYRMWDDAAQAVIEKQVKLRFSFIVADHYSLDDGDAKLDYEVIVERVDANGNVHRQDVAYFARQLGESKHELFDCDSSRNCHTEDGTARFYVYDTPHGEGITLKSEGRPDLAPRGAEIRFLRTK